MRSFASVGARLGLHATTLLALAACGGSVATRPNPNDHGSSGGAGATNVPETTTGGRSVPETTVGGSNEPGTIVGTAGEPPEPNSAGAGGDSGPTPAACVRGRSIGCACSNGQSGAQVCLADGTYGQCVCSGDSPTWDQQQLARLNNGVVGSWTGMQTNPWGSGCSTTITFEADGHYSAHSPGEKCIAFYYGSNDDSSEKTYLLNDVLPTAEGQGEIVFWFGPDDTNPGQIRHMYLSPDESELEFEVWKGDYGPLVFTLKRASN